MSDIATTTALAATKTLWAVVGVLGAAVVGLGGTLYYMQTRPAAEAQDTAIATPAPVAAPAVPATAPVVSQKQAPVVAKPKPPVAKVATPMVEESRVNSKAPELKASEPKPVCVNCATVAAVTPIEREGEASGTGAVAGGVLGAIVGNQIGRGQGKDVATIIGAIGGGIAGNQVEKKMKKVTVYQVDLRMDDGSRRTLELATPVNVGERVRVEGSNLALLPAGS